MSARQADGRPRIWKYLLAATILLLILIPAWTLFVMLVIEPESLMKEQTVGKQVLWWVAGPVLVILAVVGWRWHAAQRDEAARSAAIAAAVESQAAKQATEQVPREYVLEVISMGVTLDKYRQGALWDALKQGHPYASVREQDPKKYPWSANEKSGQEGGRVGDTLENGAKFTPIYWGVPSFYAGGPEVVQYWPKDMPIAGVVGGADSSGMAWHLFVTASWSLSERPDRLLQSVFEFFDDNPDVPYVVVASNDGMEARDMSRAYRSPLQVKDGYYIPDMPDASAMFVLARRERVEPVRPFAFDDVDEEKVDMDELNRDGFARRLFLAYNDLSRSFPRIEDGPLERQPTVAEWLPAAHAFTQRDDIYPPSRSLLFPPEPGTYPPREFKPTPWFPLPWNKDQLADFDRLPTFGFLHRPVFVKTVDENGQPLARRDARAAALAAGWQQALQTLPEAERKAAPARVVCAAAGAQATEQVIALTTVLDDWAGQGGPEIDKSKADRWIDTSVRLGNTGAATWFMQIAIGLMGSYRDGGTSAAINLRDPAEASIVMITPPSDALRKSQQHPRGGDVLRHYATPAIDPANYRN